MMRPGSVFAHCGVSAPLSKGGRGRASLARPKSMILTCPDSVSITFFGLRSRWTMPRGVRLHQALDHLDREVERALRVERRPRDQRGERPAAHQLHRDEGRAVGLVDLVDDRHRRVSERGGRARLLLEAPALLGVAAGRGAEHLERHLAAEGRVEGAVDDADAAPAQLFEHFVV